MDVIFVDRSGVAKYFLRSRPRVGPILSLTNGITTVTVDKSCAQILEMAQMRYFQPQLPQPEAMQ